MNMDALIAMPEVSVEVDGAPLPAAEARAVAHVRVREGLSIPSACQLTFGDAEHFSPEPGESLRVGVDDGQTLFEGSVTAVEHVYGADGSREVRVRAYDALHALRGRQPVRAHVGLDAAGLARDLVADLGLTVEAEEPGPVWQELIQYRQSDLEMLCEVTERSGLYFALRGDVLHILTLRGLGDAVELTLGESLLEAKVEVNGAGACRSVATSAWDPSRVEPRSGTASSARVGREVLAEAPPDSSRGGGERRLVNEAVRDDRQAEAIAQGELDRRTAREVVLWGVAQGDPQLRAGTRVEVRGLAAQFEGRYVLTEVTHTIDAQKGYVVEFTTEPAPPRARSRGAVAAWGIVTKVNDPDGLGRVKVSLPTYNDVETPWMGVVTVGAGKGKGLVSLPDVNDHVLALFVNDEPGQGVVIGGLYGANAPPDKGGVEGTSIRRYTFTTPGGQRLHLDDTKKQVEVRNSDGSSLRLSPRGVTLHSSRDLTIEAPGRTVSIHARAIRFEEAS
jgi:uncharacterized protein involved in type VI secretion and phage assembly